MSTPFESIRARHQRLEGMTSTQSPDILQELRSQAHKDRAWLIEELQAALSQNDKLHSELGRLDEAVDKLERPAKKVAKKGKRSEVENG